MVVLNIADSTLTEIVSPSDSDTIDGVAFDAAFLDDDTVIYWSMRSGEDPVTRVSSNSTSWPERFVRSFRVGVSFGPAPQFP